MHASIQRSVLPCVVVGASSVVISETKSKESDYHGNNYPVSGKE